MKKFLFFLMMIVLLFAADITKVSAQTNIVIVTKTQTINVDKIIKEWTLYEDTCGGWRRQNQCLDQPSEHVHLRRYSNPDPKAVLQSFYIILNANTGYIRIISWTENGIKWDFVRLCDEKVFKQTKPLTESDTKTP